jgi:uncharacterized membrane protein YkvI
VDGLRHIWRVYIIPAGVFQSLMIGGGYGTGREVVEYFSRFGLTGGLYGLAVVGVGFAILLAVSFEFARTYHAYDYRRFCRELLGRGWIAFEALYLGMFTLVLAVIAAASASLVETYLHLPGTVGVACLLAFVMLFAFYGRKWVARILAFKALALCAVFFLYFAIVVFRSRERIAAQFSDHQVLAGWATAATRYMLYSSVIVPTMLFATMAIATRKQAIACGVTSAIAGVLPAALLHISFSAGYPEVLSQPIPLYWMVASLKSSALTLAYLAVLFGSLFDVGIGFIQSVNERIDGWSMERHGTVITPKARAGIALLCVLASGSLSLVGIVKLIAQGYGTMAYGFLILFVGPLLTVGLYRVRPWRSLEYQKVLAEETRGEERGQSL